MQGKLCHQWRSAGLLPGPRGCVLQLSCLCPLVIVLRGILGDPQVSQKEAPAAVAAESNGSAAVSTSEEQPSRFAPSETLEDGRSVLTLHAL